MPQVVVGLGNPGGEYARTRHNAGWMCLDELEKRGRFSKPRKDGQAKVQTGDIEGFDLVLVRPQTYMNNSGKAASRITDELGVDPRDVIVVHDDIDLPLGRIRVRRGGSAGGQKGVQSLISSWRTPDFTRVKIGVGRPAGDEVVDYVLDPFTPQERQVLGEVLGRAASAVVSLIRNGLEPTMTEFNRQIET
jgi:peptidyl-tRNA hydrolase, PTH1 family